MTPTRIRFLVGALILAILAAAAWWVLRAESQDPAPAANGRAESGASPAARGAEAAAALPAQGASAAQPERTAAALDGQQTNPAAEPLRIQVVEGAEKTPVPDALVTWIHREDPAFEELMLAFDELDPETAMRERGKSARSDAEGMVVVADPGTMLMAAARSGDRYGSTMWAPEFSPDRVLLLPISTDRSFRVRVVTPAGAAVAGVPLGLFAPHDGRFDPTARTDAQGEAVFRHLQTRFFNEAPDLMLSFAFPLLDRPRIPIRWEDPPQEPVILTLPPIGSVEVAVLDADGAPMQPMFGVVLQQHAESARHNPAGGDPFRERASLGVATIGIDANGVAHFPWMGVGLELDAAARFQSGANVWTVATFPGPAEAGARVRVELRPEQLVPVAVFTPRDPGNGIYPDSYFEATLRWTLSDGKTRVGERLYCTSDLNGLCRVSLPASIPDRWTGRELRVRSRTMSAALPAEAFLDLSAPLAPGENLFGDLPLIPLPLLAGGSVVDELGQPVASARIRVWRIGDAQFRPGPWIERVSYASTDVEGNFQLGGRLDEGDYELVAESPAFSEARVLLVPGSSSHRIVMGRGAVLAGRVLLDEELVEQEMIVRVYDAAADPRSVRPLEQVTLMEDGRFGFAGLASGTLRVQIIHSRSETLAAEIQDVALIPGAAPDPRLNPLDLRGKFRRIRLLFLDENGAQLNHARLLLLVPPPATRRWGNAAGGQGIILTTAGEVQVAVGAEGYAAQILEKVTGDTTVRRERAPEVEFVLQDPEIMRKYPGTVATGFWQSPMSDGWMEDLSIRLDADGRARLVLPGWGDFRICLLVKNGSRMVSVSGPDIKAWHLASFAQGQPGGTFVIPDSLAEVERVLAAQQLPQDE
jgi:hypothetical protein